MTAPRGEYLNFYLWRSATVISDMKESVNNWVHYWAETGEKEQGVLEPLIDDGWPEGLFVNHEPHHDGVVGCPAHDENNSNHNCHLQGFGLSLVQYRSGL